MAGGEVARVDHAHLRELGRRDVGILITGGEARAERDVNDRIVFLQRLAEQILINTHGNRRRAAKLAAGGNVCENFRRLNVDPVLIALAAHVDKQRGDLNPILCNLFGRKIAGAVGSDLDLHKKAPFMRLRAGRVS